MANNVFGEPLTVCSVAPLTGYYRDGCCETGEDDAGTHTVCAVMTDAFLYFSRTRGNDLISPLAEYGFPGLKAGDRWCLCASRWMEAYFADVAPPVILEATHEKTLEYLPLQELVKFAYQKQ